LVGREGFEVSSPSVIGGAPGGYRVLFELGRGGMGTAFLARAEGVGGFERLVVIKRIRPEKLEARSIERFLREARLAAAIHHANVVGTQNVGEDAEGPFIVLDYVDGASLDELLDRALLKQQPMPVPIMLRIALDALAGIEAVHQLRDPKGVPLNALHRDVSLQNILVGRDGLSRLLDFGIARSDLGGASTDQRYLVGKLSYLPPEYLQRQPVGPSCDVYGLGVTMWLALTGKELWPGSSEAQILHQIIQEGVPPLSKELSVAPEIVDLVSRACARDVTARFQSAREMAAAIEDLGRDRGWLATHHEVAQLVNEVVGTDLSRRRERIASLLSGPHVFGQRNADTSRQTARATIKVNVGRRALALGALGLIVTTIGAIALLRRGRPEAPVPTPDRSGQPAHTDFHESVPSSAPLASATTASTTSASATIPSAVPVRRKGPITVKPTLGPARAPDQISKQNPYRR
jgi:eukaryotic-like serine/threonine-protein kinase